ncbi:unnamed protein product [Rotaria sp. Silwood1]|nr:unnamed protein product [Rotaria sp. Silwood1]
MQDEIEAFEVVLKQSNDDLVTYKEYSKEREVEKIEIVDAPFHSTLCQNCNYVCHSRCKLDETTTVGSQIFQRCWAISNGNCRQCTHKCSYTSHYHAKKTVKTSKQKLQDVIAEIKAKYDQAAQNKSDYQKKITSTADAKKMLENALLQKNEEIKQLCIQLRQLCSGFNIAHELHAFIDQLEVEAAILKNIEAKQQANAFIRSLKEFCDMIEKDQDVSQNQSTKMNIMDTERPVQSQARLPKTLSANTMTSTQQLYGSANPHFESPADSNSYANNDVLQALRAIREKKKKVPRKKLASNNESETDEKEEDEKNNGVTSEDSNQEESDEKSKKHQKKTKKQSASNLATTVTNDPDQFKTMTIDELLTHYRACTELRMTNFIVHEMMQRASGKSVGPLNSPERIVEFTASSHKYCALRAHELRQEYDRLKSRIAVITEPDILKIDQVPQTVLFDIAAVHILLQRATSEGHPPPPATHNSYNYNSQPSPSINIPYHHTEFPNHVQNHDFSMPKPPQSRAVYNSQFQQSTHSFASSQRPQYHPYKYNEGQNVPTYTSEPPPYDYQNGPTNQFSHQHQHRHQQQQSTQYVQDPTLVPSSASSFNLQTTFGNMHLSADHPDNVIPTNNHCSLNTSLYV